MHPRDRSWEGGRTSWQSWSSAAREESVVQSWRINSGWGVIAWSPCTRRMTPRLRNCGKPMGIRHHSRHSRSTCRVRMSARDCAGNWIDCWWGRSHSEASSIAPSIRGPARSWSGMKPRSSTAWKVSALSLALVVGAVVDLMPTGGSIVYVSGGAPSRTIPGLAGLGASKASGETIVRYLARELVDRRIRVNTVRSGQVATETYLASRFGDASGKPPEVTPLGRPLEPNDVARAVAFLLSDEAAMITGVMLPADGGRNLT